MALRDEITAWLRSIGNELADAMWRRVTGGLSGWDTSWAAGPSKTPPPGVESAQALGGLVAAGNRLALAVWNVGALFVSAMSVLHRYAQAAWGQRFQEYDRAFRPALLPAGEVLEAWRRGLFTDDQALDLLRRQGYAEEQVQALAELRKAIPTPSDVVRFAAREAYEPDQIRLLGLDTDFDQIWQQARADAEAAGLSRELFRRYWHAHWEPLSVTQAIDLHRRNPERYPIQFVEAIAKANEVVPSQVPALLELTEDLLSLVDLRRAYELGLLTDQDVLREGKRRGLSDRDAQVFLGIAKAIRDGELRSTRRARADLTRPQLERAYRDGIITREQLSRALADLGYDDDERELLLALQDAQVQSETRGAHTRAVRALYERGLWTRDQAAVELRSLGYRQDAIDRLLVVWDLELLAKGASESQEKARDLTKQELLHAFEDDLLSRDEVVGQIRRLGYDPDEAETLVAIAERRKLRESNRATEAALHEQYIAGQVDRLEVVTALDAIGTPTQRRDALLRRWDIERLRRGQQFTVDQVRQLYLRGLISRQRAHAELSRIRYTDEQAELLLRLWSGEQGTENGSEQTE